MLSVFGNVNKYFKVIFSNVMLALILTVIFSAASNNVSAASIHGDIYSVTLDKELNARIEINTLPKQVLISKDGSYRFNVPVGNYTLTTISRDGFSKEGISVIDNEGDYVIDIVLEPTIYNSEANFSEITNITNDSDIGQYIVEQQVNTRYPWTLIIILFLASLSIIYTIWKMYRRQDVMKRKSQKRSISQIRLQREAKIIPDNKNHEEKTSSQLNVFSDEYSKNALSIIKKEKRITQKDLRRQIPLSEGKISLILTHLEYDGKIRKIKKGRGNILIFVKE
jgi:uncharacterized membrane protein